jgi:hypothetical protein
MAFLGQKGRYCGEFIARADTEHGKIGPWSLAVDPEPCLGIRLTSTLFCLLRTTASV